MIRREASTRAVRRSVLQPERRWLADPVVVDSPCGGPGWLGDAMCRARELVERPFFEDPDGTLRVTDVAGSPR